MTGLTGSLSPKNSAAFREHPNAAAFELIHLSHNPIRNSVYKT